ncbi:hypothetical protein ACFWVP_17565 [Streptomyces sp. NPDC058637]|uniref:hypothetical protein n=1 Tax=Streptomyces sp. NPDC058637 TaxID=3346569 RepID=UPI0036468CCF
MPIKQCQHAPCGKPFPPGTDRRKRYCDDTCRKAANRAVKASQGPTLATVHPISPVVGEADSQPLAEDVVKLWERFMNHVTTDGLMVMGTAGVPVAHPLLRNFTGLYAAMKEQTGSGPVEPADEFEKIMSAARKRVAEIQAAEEASYR